MFGKVCPSRLGCCGFDLFGDEVDHDGTGCGVGTLPVSTELVRLGYDVLPVAVDVHFYLGDLVADVGLPLGLVMIVCAAGTSR